MHIRRGEYVSRNNPLHLFDIGREGGNIVRSRVMDDTLHTGAVAVRYRTGDEILYDPESWATTEDKFEEKMFLETTLYTGTTFIRYRTGERGYCTILPSQGQQHEMKARGRCF